MMLRSSLRKQWEERIADYCQSGLSAREWCEQNGIAANRLSYWLKRSRESAQSTGWASVEIVDRNDGNEGVSVHIGPAIIEVHPGFDPSLLSQVLQVVNRERAQHNAARMIYHVSAGISHLIFVAGLHVNCKALIYDY